MVETAAFAGTEGLLPGAFLVDLIPISMLQNQRFLVLISQRVRYIPEWIPGASFKRKANKWRVEIEKCCEAPYDATRRTIVVFFCGAYVDGSKRTYREHRKRECPS